MPLTINGERIPDRILDREMLRLSAGLEMDAPRAGGIDPASLRALAFRNVIDRKLLLQTAYARNLSVTPDQVESELVRRWGVSRSTVCDPGFMDSIREDLLLERVRADLTRQVPRPGRAEAERYYRMNQHLYQVPEAVEAAHILRGFTSAEDEQAAYAAIRQAEDELHKGKSFQQVANRYSDCKGVGGTVGWVVRGQMVQEFEDVIFALSLDNHSGIFRSVFGFHIATVTRRRKAGVTPFNEVRLEIAKRMFAEARQRTLAQILGGLNAESEIHYMEDAADA